MDLEIVLIVCRWVALIAGVPSLFIGLILVLNPEIMKRINDILNFKIETNKIEKIFDNVVLSIDDWVMLKPRFIGVILVAIAIALIFSGYQVVLR